MAIYLSAKIRQKMVSECLRFSEKVSIITHRFKLESKGTPDGKREDTKQTFLEKGIFILLFAWRAKGRFFYAGNKVSGCQYYQRIDEQCGEDECIAVRIRGVYCRQDGNSLQIEEGVCPHDCDRCAAGDYQCVDGQARNDRRDLGKDFVFEILIEPMHAQV